MDQAEIMQITVEPGASVTAPKHFLDPRGSELELTVTVRGCTDTDRTEPPSDETRDGRRTITLPPGTRTRVENLRSLGKVPVRLTVIGAACPSVPDDPKPTNPGAVPPADVAASKDPPPVLRGKPDVTAREEPGPDPYVFRGGGMTAAPSPPSRQAEWRGGSWLPGRPDLP